MRMVNSTISCLRKVTKIDKLLNLMNAIKLNRKHKHQKSVNARKVENLANRIIKHRSINKFFKHLIVTHCRKYSKV